MDFKYFKETKVTKKTDPKKPVQVAQEGTGFMDEYGEFHEWSEFFASLDGNSINLSATIVVKEELEEDDTIDGEE